MRHRPKLSLICGMWNVYVFLPFFHFSKYSSLQALYVKHCLKRISRYNNLGLLRDIAEWSDFGFNKNTMNFCHQIARFVQSLFPDNNTLYITSEEGEMAAKKRSMNSRKSSCRQFQSSRWAIIALHRNVLL
jgi:hypothetical protein